MGITLTTMHKESRIDHLFGVVQCGFPFSSPFSPHGLARYPHESIVGEPNTQNRKIKRIEKKTNEIKDLILRMLYKYGKFLSIP